MNPSRRFRRPRQGLGGEARATAEASSVLGSLTDAASSSSSSDSQTTAAASVVQTGSPSQAQSKTSVSGGGSSTSIAADSTSGAVTNTASTALISSASSTSQSLSLSSTNSLDSATRATVFTLFSPPTTTSTPDADINPPTTTPASSSLIHTTILVKTTATVNGHATTFSTLVPTTLSVFPPSSSPALKSSAVAGTIIGVLVVCALLALLASLFYRRRKQRRRQAQQLHARRSHRRVLDDGDDDVVPMSYTASGPGSVASSSHEGPYRYGVVGAMAPPTPGPNDVFGPAPDAFLGKDPATIRHLKASRAGSASGSVFREELGDDGPGTSHSPSPSFVGRNFSHDRFSTNSSSVAGLLSDAGRAGSTDTLNPPKRTTPPPPSPFYYPPDHPSARVPFIFTSTSQFSLTTAQPSHLVHSPLSQSLPPGAATAVGPNKRNSLIVDEQFGVGGSHSPDFVVASPQAYSPPSAYNPPHQYHYRKRRSADRGSTRSSFTIDMPIRGDGSLTNPDAGSQVDLRPYMSSDDEDGPLPSSRGRQTGGMG